MTKGCDLELGICEIPSLEDEAKSSNEKLLNATLFYVGDPMCSWCWGVSPALKKIEQYCEDKKINFDIVVGGLRAGGGDPWNNEFKSFLKNEWSHIQKVTGQPFSFKLLEREFFNYDTEPACRGFVILSKLIDEMNLPKKEKLEVFSKIQNKFYVVGIDPKEASFYEEICNELGISFKKFTDDFISKESILKTRNEFIRALSLKVKGFPSLVFVNNDKRILVSSGYFTKDKVVSVIEESLKGEV